MLEDSQGNLWFGTHDKGVMKYQADESGQGGTFTTYSTEVGLSDSYVRSMIEDRKGNIWFGTMGGGVTKYEPGEKGTEGSFIHYTTQEGLSHNTVHSVTEDSQGNPIEIGQQEWLRWANGSNRVHDVSLYRTDGPYSYHSS